MLALYGLKWNPFTPNVPTEALHVTTRADVFAGGMTRQRRRSPGHPHEAAEVAALHLSDHWRRGATTSA